VTPTLLFALAIVGGLDAGIRVGGAFPAAGLAPVHSSSAIFGAEAGWTSGRSRLQLDYGYAGLPGPQASPYRLDIHTIALRYGFEFVQQPGWGIGAAAGGSWSFLRRSLLDALETGTSPAAHLGVGFIQHQGHNRLKLGVDNAVFIGSSRDAGTTRTALSWLVTLEAGVGYAF
jgi:hypothetical protein